ncbi:MAG: phosphatase PAP2 family protein, partial [Chloroflexota bacterium]|nr:phosphatase PAP2 family protein [Chloroflexota bacterium]
QQYSSYFGSGAIAASALLLLPSARRVLTRVAVLAGSWGVFVTARALSDSAGMALGGPDAVARFERALFGGKQASAWIQDGLHDTLVGRILTIGLIAVYGSFFIAPVVSGLVAVWRGGRCFRVHVAATVATLAVSCLGFILLPTAPPWMTDEGSVERLVQQTIGSGEGGGWSFEPNAIAAFPSVHVAAATLLSLTLLREVSSRRALLFLYPAAMSLAIVWLGEHFVADAIAGLLLPLGAWALAERYVANAADVHSSATEAGPVSG